MCEKEGFCGFDSAFGQYVFCACTVLRLQWALIVRLVLRGTGGKYFEGVEGSLALLETT